MTDSNTGKIITIDGPSGAGKGTVSRLLAKHLAYDLLDSGAMYRIAALAAQRAGAELDCGVKIAALCDTLDIQFVAEDDATRVLLAKQDVSVDIRTEHTGMVASKIAALPEVRAALLERQRAFASARGLVADGRDMGTVVFPQAQTKIFLTASAEERARRRILQLQQAQVSDINEQQVLEDIKRRDEQDMSRAIAPLKPAHDASIIDSSALSVAQVIAEIKLRL